MRFDEGNVDRIRRMDFRSSGCFFQCPSLNEVDEEFYNIKVSIPESFFMGEG